MEEEILAQENTVPGRRTRSGRKASAPVAPPVVRSTRRSNRKQQNEFDEQDNQVTEILSDDMEGVEHMDSEAEHEIVQMQPNEMIDYGVNEQMEPVIVEQNIMAEELDTIIEQIEPEQVEDDKSSSFPFGDIPSEMVSGQENSSADHEDIDNSFFANLAAEENANSLPSATDEIQDDSLETEVMVVENGEEQNEEFEEKSQPPEEDIINNIALDEDENANNEQDEVTLTQEQPLVEEQSENCNMADVPDEKTTPSEDKAIAEDAQNGGSTSDQTIDPDTEMVSEDELPTPAKPEVQDAEEVSDDELPGPKLAELPADTEVVSEDELPSAKKDTSVSNATKRKAEDEGYDPGSPTGENDMPEKKTKVETEIVEVEVEEKKKKLPDLEKYWKAVKDDPADFTGWTYLLQYVDQENDLEAAREAYDAFLAHYPYCYGYWRKYADYEKRKGNKDKCEEVFERGLKGIPLSVDLWIHYLAHVKINHAEDEQHIRDQFERAIEACGLEFRSDKLWEAYIKWEMEGKRISKVVVIYDRLLATPTQGYNNHFDSFQELVNNNTVQCLIGVEEIKKIRTEVRELLDTKDKPITESDIPPGEEEPDDHLRSEEEITAVKDKILSQRRKVHKATVAAVTERWTFEEGIKRPYFHVKPLERCQLKNWKEYLDFEIEKCDRKRILVLFERCLIACALYDEFWLKLIRYLESQTDPELEPITRDVYERACVVHHPDKPSMHLMWSAFEELHNNGDKASEILTAIEKVCPNLLQIAYRRINLERRRQDYDKCVELYNHYINQAKNKNISSSLAIKYARFTHKIRGDLDGGLMILRSALEKDPSNARIALQMIDLALQRDVVDEIEVVKIMDDFMSTEGMDPEQRVLFAQRKVEFLEDFGSTAKGLQDAQRALQVALSKAGGDGKKKQSDPSSSKKMSSSKEVSAQGSAVASSASYPSNYPYQGTTSYYYGNRGADSSTSASYYNDYSQQQWGYSQYQWGGGYGSYNY